MASERNPNDPYRVDDPYRAGVGDHDVRRQFLLDNELQAAPELADGPAGGSKGLANSGKIAILALSIALVLGAVFYRLNNSWIHRTGISSTVESAAPTTARNTAPASPPAAPPGMRDVNPRANTGSGVTTGAAPSQTPPPPAPAGSTSNTPASR